MQAELTVVRSGAYVIGDPNRLESNARLRDACDGLYDDAGLRSYILAVETDRLNGWTLAEESDALLSGVCQGPFPEINLLCSTCSLAVLNQVYSIENSPPETETATEPFDDTLIVLDDGTPDIDEDIAQVGFMVIRMTSHDLSVAPGAAVLNYTFDIDLVNSTDGSVLATLTGVGKDTYTEISDTQIAVVSQGSAGYSDSFGTMSISYRYTGTLTK